VLDSVAECLRDAPNLAQGKITLVQLTLRNSFIDDLVDQLLDLLRSRFIQTSRSTLDGIRQTDDAALFELRFRPAVTEAFLTNFGNIFFPHIHDFASFPGVLLLLECPFVKITDQRRPVVLLDY